MVVLRKRVTGIVKFFSIKQEYGFISMEQGGDIYVAKEDCDDFPLIKGNKVIFDIVDSQKDSKEVQAANVRWAE